ncbi:uncharacterized protein V6R79_010072 [Siganus canaliculatus]
MIFCWFICNQLKDLPSGPEAAGFDRFNFSCSQKEDVLCLLWTIFSIGLIHIWCPSEQEVVQLTLVFQSQSAVQEAKEKDLTRRLEKLNQSYQLLFSQYPALNQYCPVSNSSSSERVCSPCPTGWTPQGQKCFLFSEDRSDWISGQYRCLTLGGVMATVRTEDEQVFLWRTAQSRSHGDSYWLGMRSGGGEEGWQWSDGSPVVKGPGFWQREPSGTDNRELCGRLTPGDNYRVSWFTSRCSSQMRRICERKQAALQ